MRVVFSKKTAASLASTSSCSSSSDFLRKFSTNDNSKSPPRNPLDQPPSKEFINTINELASKAKFPNPVEDIRKVFDSQESRDFRNLLAQRRQKINQGIKLTEEEVQTMMKAYAKGIKPQSEQLKRICRKYTLIEL